MANITITDINEIERELNIVLTDEQRESVLREYGRVVMDRGESWTEIIIDLINKTI
jgi:KaiC/GvpD/RAD55 family RecA-like ATPase